VCTCACRMVRRHTALLNRPRPVTNIGVPRIRKRKVPVQRPVYTTVEREHDALMRHFEKQRHEIPEQRRRLAVLEEEYRVVCEQVVSVTRQLATTSTTTSMKTGGQDRADMRLRLRTQLQSVNANCARIRLEMDALRASIERLDPSTQMLREEIDYTFNLMMFLERHPEVGRGSVTTVARHQTHAPAAAAKIQPARSPSPDTVFDAFEALNRGGPRDDDDDDDDDDSGDDVVIATQSSPMSSSLQQQHQASSSPPAPMLQQQPSPSTPPPAVKPAIGALEEYLVLIGKRPKDEAPRHDTMADRCVECNGSDLVLDEVESTQTCRTCATSVPVLLHGRNQVPYADKYETISESGYSRITHFNEMLSQLQAKGRSEVPDEVIERVRDEFVRSRTRVSDIDTDRVRKMLKKIKQTRYYEQVAAIAYRISGIRPPMLTSEQEDRLRSQFLDVLEAYEDCPISIKGNRINFISYSHLFHKLGLHNKIEELVTYFRVVKSPVKFRQHEETLHWIFTRLGWRFIPSSMRR